MGFKAAERNVAAIMIAMVIKALTIVCMLTGRSPYVDDSMLYEFAAVCNQTGSEFHVALRPSADRVSSLLQLYLHMQL